METFYTDLKKGEKIELTLLKEIQKKYPKAHKIDGYFKDYDLFVPEVNKSIEVKSDEKSIETGNIVVEVEFNGKPSALSTTKADYWVWWDGFNFTWFETKSIHNCIKETNQKIRQFTGKGDTKSKKAYLIKKETLYNYSI
jgi:hypothetical protein|tara:strand:- start:203 stop:622 length:420 start_codon:yes stop_codon:yes gene_type:complete